MSAAIGMAIDVGGGWCLWSLWMLLLVVVVVAVVVVGGGGSGGGVGW